MHVSRLADAPEYIARGHSGVRARRIQGREAGGPHCVAVSISEYPPGSGGDSVTATTEVVYVVLEGTMRIRSGGQQVDLPAGDSVAFSPYEPRAAHNVTDLPARLLVIHKEARPADG